jgi:hypothetical protein
VPAGNCTYLQCWGSESGSGLVGIIVAVPDLEAYLLLISTKCESKVYFFTENFDILSKYCKLWHLPSNHLISSRRIISSQTGNNFWKSPFRFLFKISNLCKNIMPMK